jgi:DNA-binding CsgD family transcriptional regulator
MTIDGEPGIGKSALFEAAVAMSSGLRVLRVRCVEAESGLAYAGIADLLGGWTQTVLPALPPPQRRALEIALLRTDSGGDLVEPHAVGRAVLEVLQLLAADVPVLVAIDDVQWLDPASARTLAFVIRRVADRPVSVLVTRRGTEDPSPLGVDDAFPASCRHRLLVGPMDASDLQMLLNERFPGGFPRGMRSRILAAAVGNPLYATELAGAQVMSDGSTRELLTLSSRLEELLADRLRRLPRVAAEPVAAVAAHAAPTVASVTAALGVDAKVGLGCALDARVLHVSEGRLWFSHPLLGVAALQQLAPSARRALHARLAVSAADEEERARHLVLSVDGPDADAAAAAERAADQARARGAPEAAAELAEAAVRLTPPGHVADISRRRVASGYHWVTSGQTSRGRALIAAALDGTPPGPARTELQWRLGMVAFLDGDLDAAVSLLEQALTASAGGPAERAIAARRLAGVYGWQGRLDDARRYTGLSVAWAEEAGDPQILIEALTCQVWVSFLAGTDLPAGIGDHIEQLAHTTQRAPLEDPDLFIAMVDLPAGRTELAAERLERAYRRAAECGDELGLAWASGCLVQAELAAGRWPRARKLAEESLLNARATASPPVLASALLFLALVEAYAGNAGPARAAASELIDIAQRHGLVPLEMEGRTVDGYVAFTCGDARGAHAELSVLLKRRRQMGVRMPGWPNPLIWSELDVLVELGELDQAADLAADLQGRGQELSNPFALATAARGHGMIQAARGDFTGAQAALERSLTEQDRLGWPFERARTLLALGVVLRRGKHKRAARDALDQALAIFDRLGARLWSARTTTELARIGGRAPSAGALTVTERRIAELVADGYTNRQVADRLFLSPKTVAAHLTSTYAKLGVRSRTELSVRLRRSDAPNPPP